MKPLVYIETTIPSYYCSRRQTIAADISRTKEWWDKERGRYDCFISAFVLDELAGGKHETKEARLQLVKDLTSLQTNDRIEEIALIYQQEKLMPKTPTVDASHLAVASFYHMDVLLTWNCRHLANFNKQKHLEALNKKLGLPVPMLLTPNLLRLPEDS